MPVPRARHLQAVEDAASLEDRPPSEPGHPSRTLSPVEDECFSEWLAAGQPTDNGGEEGLWEEPRWEEPPARFLERLAGRVRPKRTTR